MIDKRMFLLGSPAFVEESVKNLSSDYKIVGVAYSVEEARMLTEELQPDMVIIDADIQDGAIEAGIELMKNIKNGKCYIASDYFSIDLLQRAVAKGLAGLLKKPLIPEDVAETIIKLEKYGADYVPDFESDGPKKEILVFYSPKGGVGKTTLAVNTAGVIASGKNRKKVIVADFDIWSNVETMLQMKGRYSLADWASNMESDVKEYILSHPSGFDLFPGIRKITDGGILTAEFAAKLLGVLKSIYDVVIVDLNSVINDSTPVVFENATRIFVVGTLEIPTLKGLNDLNDVFGLMGIGTYKARMVLNRIPEKPDISVKEVAKLIPFPLVAKIKEDAGIRGAVNKGEIYCIKNPDSEFAAEISKLAAGIVKTKEWPKQKEKKSLLRLKL